MLPPDSTTTTGGSKARGSSITAASAAAPAGSTTSLARSSASSSARDSASSSTMTTSSTRSRTSANGRSPGQPTAMPSAIVVISASGTGRPAASDGRKVSAPAACAATTRACGRSALTATAIPATSPPPPVHTTTVLTSGHCSTSSSPTVPCPATTSAWSKGWMSTGPGLRREVLRVHQRLVDGAAGVPDLRAVRPGGRHLGQRRGRGHEDGRRAVQQGGGQRHPLRVVARAGRHDAAGPLLRRQPGDPDVRPADLERAGALEVLALEQHRAADLLGQPAQALERGGAADPLQHLARGQDVLQPDRRQRCARHASSLAPRAVQGAPEQRSVQGQLLPDGGDGLVGDGQPARGQHPAVRHQRGHGHPGADGPAELGSRRPRRRPSVTSTGSSHIQFDGDTTSTETSAGRAARRAR
jgi:hypothetical protein